VTVAFPQVGQRLTDVLTGLGLDHVDVLAQELDEYWDTLLGRTEPPNLPHHPYLALQEIAVAYLGRALEMESLILRGERKGAIAKGSELQKFRTGELANFIVLARKAADLGSRRLTEIQMITDHSRGSL
jgi:hypothetical protein